METGSIQTMRGYSYESFQITFRKEYKHTSTRTRPCKNKTVGYLNKVEEKPFAIVGMVRTQKKNENPRRTLSISTAICIDFSNGMYLILYQTEELLRTLNRVIRAAVSIKFILSSTCMLAVLPGWNSLNVVVRLH